jgi:hypothetical protein
VKRVRRVLTSAQSSVKPPVFRTLTAFPCELSSATLKDSIPCSCPGQCHKYSPPKRYDAFSDINHSLRGIIGLVTIVDLIVDHSVVYCCLTKLRLRPQHDTLHLSISRTTLVESHLLGATVHLLELPVLLDRLSPLPFILDACGDRS